MIETNMLVTALEAKAGACLRCEITTTAWCSLSLEGERHELTLFPSKASTTATLLHGLEDHEFDLPGGFVADIFIEAAEIFEGMPRVRIEVLTLTDT